MAFLKRVIEWVTTHWAVIVLIGFAAGIQIFLISQPLQYLLSSILPDDAFYYFEIVRNITQGAGSTFDGENFTNGYHPLWALILIPIFALFSHGGTMDLEPIRAALAVSVLINIGTLTLLYQILGHLTKDRMFRFAGLFFYALNPFVLTETINGLETALSLFSIAVFFLVTLYVEKHETRKTYAWLGIVGGIMILARLDTALYFAAVLLWLCFRKGWSHGFARVCMAGVIATAICSPWFIWNVTHFGMLLTSASETGSLVSHTLIIQDHGASVFQSLKATVYNLYNAVDTLLVRTGALWVVLILFGVYITTILKTLSSIPRRFSQLNGFQVLGIGFLLLFFVNVAIRWGGRAWYFMSFEFFIAMLVTIVVASLSLHKKTVIFGLIVLTIFFFGVSWSREIRDQYINQVEIFSMAEWMSEHLSPNTRVGVFNSGIIGYFSNVHSINIDGLVNNASYHAMKEHRLWAYIQSEDVEYIADFPISLSYRYKSFFGIDDVFPHLIKEHSILITPTGRNPEGIVLYRIKE